MRITNSMMSNSFLRDLGRNQSNLKTLNEQLTSGKEIRRPSDNPFKVARSMQLHTDIGTNKQYNENIKDTSNWLETTDVALEQLNNSFQRIRELMVSAGNAAYGVDEKRAIKDEINEKINEVSQILNTNFDGKYIFGGTKGSSKPVNTIQDAGTGNNVINLSGKDGEILRLDSNDDTIQTQISMISKKLKVEVTQGVTMDYSVSATDLLVFKGKNEKVNVMNFLTELTNNLDSTDPIISSRVVNENLLTIDETMANIHRIRSEVGAKMNRMESAQEQNEEHNFNMTDILSKTEDIDFAEKTMEVSVAKSIYMASLQTSARILQPTLIDFIK
ncbi:flagellar hook-associated protein FlgL [Clostridium chauvoei]|uniref:Flagellar hook-associated protein FlgL n=2 Tax=Clostridium chauvoei TaxID=46867 RepID=A0ABD4RJ04_9CLOT|nr:flagellar hook-associated protein FlgL [Clostridium chauvoei]ATD54617.1 flagellar hook-associated protein 3 [Clostridium chauvoei]ATD57702.1 flagellar hook-associated protein 3 [Clostridium chauvoei]MBX7281029.1 flagellar hook-associated protein FlgL [Clostridium chauvoei]MBX7283470.1 flagellar hook-associated protein FlgL [Clostridium chauvoei]MBX7286118.1 flagellar hook-associated protein FlgL [Clostridium chauvoei]